MSLKVHRQEICGISINPFEKNVVASGGNDNMLSVSDLRMGKHFFNVEGHSAAIRGIEWNRLKKNELFTGGGTGDRKLKLWNVHSKEIVRSIYTGSQICKILYMEELDEIVTSHGFSSNNISIWDSKNLHKLAELTGHSKRVLYCVKTHRQNQILSGSADQSLRFWDLVPKYGSKYSKTCICNNEQYCTYNITKCHEVISSKKGIFLGEDEKRKKWNRQCLNKQTRPSHNIVEFWKNENDFEWDDLSLVKKAESNINNFNYTELF